MKQNFFLNQTQRLCAFLIIFALTLLWQSCKKQVTSLSPDPNVENTIDNPKKTRAAYTSYPQPNTGFPPNNSSAALTLNGATGPHLGGMIKAQVTYQSGNQFIIQIVKQAGGNFPVGTIGRLRMGSVSYTSLATTAPLATASNVINITINIGFNQGFLNLMPIAEFGGSKYYAEPISIYTSPIYNSGAFNTAGGLLGTINGVDVRVSTQYTNYNVAAPWSQWQCTELCKRYYSQVYGVNLNINQDAGNWWANVPAGFTFHPNGTKAPRVGDILELQKVGGGYGHVLVIIEVKDNQIRIAHQNGGTNLAPIGAILSRSGNSIISPWTSPQSNFTVKGIIRKN